MTTKDTWAAFATVAWMVLATGCPPPPPVDGGTLDGGTVDAAEEDSADSSAVTGYVPFVAGEFVRTYVPPGDAAADAARYLNDHTLIRGPDGTWHLYGITNTGQGQPFAEHSLLHATAPTLMGPWTDQPDVLSADPAHNEGCCLWAPHVVAVAPGRWLMVYIAEGGGLRRAVSTDLSTFTRVESDVTDSLRPPGGRDPFLMNDGTRWRLFSVGASPIDANTGLGQILSTELLGGDPDNSTMWSNPASPVTTDPVPNYPWGNLESPTIVPYHGQYYLFTTRTANDYDDYVRTVVLRSPDPTRFPWMPITDLRAHAAEIVLDGDQYYITSAGWTADTGEQNRGLLIAPMAWAPAPR